MQIAEATFSEILKAYVAWTVYVQTLQTEVVPFVRMLARILRMLRRFSPFCRMHVIRSRILSMQMQIVLQRLDNQPEMRRTRITYEARQKRETGNIFAKRETVG